MPFVGMRRVALTWCTPHMNAVAVTTWIGVKLYSPPSSSAIDGVDAFVAFEMDNPLPGEYVCTTFKVINEITDNVPTEMWRDVPNKK